MGNSKLIEDNLYQLLTQRAIKDEKWAAYFLIVNACYEIAKNIPETQEDCENASIDDLIEGGLEKIGEVIFRILPGGLKEFLNYMPCHTRI